MSPRPGYSEIAPASNAYFQYVNANGGVFGRKITYKYLNDQYNPTMTSNVVHQLVLQDQVYAIFNGLGTPTHLAVASYLNAQKVPDVFVASGCECWNDPSKLPDTFGWQLDYVREGKILGDYVKKHFQGKKVGVFYQDDEFGQDGLKGVEYRDPQGPAGDGHLHADEHQRRPGGRLAQGQGRAGRDLVHDPRVHRAATSSPR